MSRPKSILVATDLNDLDFLLPVAIDQARMTGAMIWLLHVIPPEAYASIEAGAYPFVGKEKEYRAAEAALAKVALGLREKNIACAYEVRRWYPVDEIKDCIREHGIDRLILGTSSRGKLGKVLVGSVAEELIRSLDIPVCTVGPSFRPLASDHPRRIVLALSLRHRPEQALRFAVDLAAGLPAELTVLNISEQDRGDEGLAAGAMSKIQELLREWSRHPAKRIFASATVNRRNRLLPNVRRRPPNTWFWARWRDPTQRQVSYGCGLPGDRRSACPTFTLRSGAKTKPRGNYREFAPVKMGSSYPGVTNL